MEQSIETARRRRLHEAESPSSSRPAPLDQRDPGDDNLPRRKARPKRSRPLTRQYDETEYRAEAI
jgi:hypothetical protein